MLVRRTTPLPIECVARGYLSGSGWKDYVATGAVCGHRAAGRAARIRSAARAAVHAGHQGRQSGHDINISEAEAAALVGAELLARLKALTLALYAHGVGARRRAAASSWPTPSSSSA